MNAFLLVAAVICAGCAVLSVGCIIADWLFPRIGFVERRLSKLPLWDEGLPESRR